MDTVSLMAAEAQYIDQGEAIDDWLLGSEFETVNQIADPSALQISHSGPTSGIGLFDPEHLLSADVFPDLTDFSPRGLDDRTQIDKEKVSPIQDGAVPPELIAIGKGSCSGLPVSNGAISVAAGTIQGLPDDPVLNNGLDIHSIVNLRSRAGSAGSHELLIDSRAGSQGGAGPRAAQELQIDSAAHPLHTELTADCSRSIQDLTSRLTQPAPDSQKGVLTARAGSNVTKKKREREKGDETAQKQSTDTAKDLARVASLPPKPSKRRKGGRAASTAAIAKAGTEGGEASGTGSGSDNAKGSSSRRPSTARARPVRIESAKMGQRIFYLICTSDTKLTFFTSKTRCTLRGEIGK